MLQEKNGEWLARILFDVLGSIPQQLLESLGSVANHDVAIGVCMPIRSR